VQGSLVVRVKQSRGGRWKTRLLLRNYCAAGSGPLLPARACRGPCSRVARASGACSRLVRARGHATGWHAPHGQLLQLAAARCAPQHQLHVVVAGVHVQGVALQPVGQLEHGEACGLGEVCQAALQCLRPMEGGGGLGNKGCNNNAQCRQRWPAMCSLLRWAAAWRLIALLCLLMPVAASRGA
jgi:hypothetical protein